MAKKRTVTVLITFTADGRICPLVVVFPYVKPPRAIALSMPGSWILGKSDSGWMRCDVFYEYVVNGFNNWLNEQNIKKPVIFLVDGHRSHMSFELSQFCDHNGIILYALPPNTTHILQPADVAVFKPLKEYWKQAVREWQNKNENCVVTKTNFCTVFADVLEKPKLPEYIRNGFRKCGLFPFNPDAVDYSKCVQNSLEALNHTKEDCTMELTTNDFQNTERVLRAMKGILEPKGVNIDILYEMKNFENITNMQVQQQQQQQQPDTANVTMTYNVSESGLLYTSRASAIYIPNKYT